MFNVIQGPTMKENNFTLRKKIMEHVNGNELVLNSSRVVLEVNERGENFYKNLRDLVELMYRCSSTYSTKINPMIPRTKFYLNYRKSFQRIGQ